MREKQCPNRVLSLAMKQTSMFEQHTIKQAVGAGNRQGNISNAEGWVNKKMFFFYFSMKNWSLLTFDPLMDDMQTCLTALSTQTAGGYFEFAYILLS